MNTETKTTILTRYPATKLLLGTGAALAALVIGVWLFVKFWPYAIAAGLLTAGYFALRRNRASISISDGVSVTTEALTGYVRKIIRELEWEQGTQIHVRNRGGSCLIRMKVNFPLNPENAADFHSRVIYTQGYLARRLRDDFKISDAKVEIEAVRREVGALVG
jgi:hypothetical protein